MADFIRTTTGSCKAFALGTTAFLALSSSAMAQQVFATDVIVQGSLCVGVDCVNPESFGFDTVRLKENNLRIKADDTSVSAGFPAVDWQITFNDSASGGLSKFSIDDITNARTPLTVEANAPTNSLYVDDGGRLGLGTSNPVVDAHMVSGNTPTLRLDQDGSSGFAPQIWDVAGNEAGFFIRDVTGGSQLPFRIKPGSPNSSVFLYPSEVVINENGADQNFRVEGDTDDGLFFVDAGAGRVSIGVPNKTPLAKLDVRDNTGSGPEQMLRLVNNGAPQILMRNSATSNNWLFSAGSNLLLAPSENTADQVFDLSSNGNLTITGSLTQLSDKNAKMAIVPVDSQDILEKVAALPVSYWTYKDEADTGVRHIGPMAQDFYAAFGTGYTEKGISSLDTGGVALAAIQALGAENLALRKRLELLEARVALK